MYLDSESIAGVFILVMGAVGLVALIVLEIKNHCA